MTLRVVQLESESLIARMRRPAFAHDWIDFPKTRPEQVVERLAGASIAITNKMAISAAAVDALPELKMIAVSAAGTHNVDIDAWPATVQAGGSPRLRGA